MDDPLIGHHLGNYRIDSIIGRGGMATVYLGFDKSLHRPVAIKLIDGRYRDNQLYTERFLQEARIVATWRHEHILQVYYAGQEEKLYYFAMEYVDGLDLNQAMRRYAADGELMPQEDVLRIGDAVASALDYSHSQNIVHRDVKPSNVMIAKDGRITLADFGLALDAQQGSLGETFGSAHYIAPEQARNSASAVPQSDLYSLGIMLYEMLTGSVPFDDPSPTSIALQHITQPPPPPRQLNPHLSLATEEVLLRAISKQPAQRYASGADLMRALTKALSQKREDEIIPLPPLPSGVAVPQPHTSTSLMHHVSLFSPPAPESISNASSSSPKPSTLDVQPSSRATGKRLLSCSIIVVFLVVLLAGGVMWFIWGMEGETGDTTLSAVFTPNPTPTEKVTVSFTATETETVATNTAIPADPTLTPAIGRTTIVTPTSTTQVTSTLVSTAEPTLTVPPPAPATATPSGPRLVMIYDHTSFYVYNPNPDYRVRVSQLLFESLDASGELNGYWFEGQLWSQFYSFIEPFNCNRLEISNVSGWLRPSQCRQYNASVTPVQDGDIVFWTQQEDSVAFRVLWQGNEVGRCQVDANRCEVYLP